MIGPQVEYVGFVTSAKAREYTLRVRRGDEAVEVILAIPNEAFLSHRVRFQDGPEICFLKLQKELLAGDGPLPAWLSVDDSELEDYRTAHAPKPPRRHPPKPAPTA